MGDTESMAHKSDRAAAQALSLELERLYTPTEVAALANVPGHLVESEIADGVLKPDDEDGGLPFASLPYLRALSQLRFKLDIAERERLRIGMEDAVRPQAGVEEIALSELLVLRVGALVRSMREDCRRFLIWKERLVRNLDVLAGDPLFPGSRLSVYQIGSIRPWRGSPKWTGLVVEPLARAYPYLTEDDLEFATTFVRAYPARRTP